MKLKTNDLTGAALDWAVSKAEGSLSPLGNVILKGNKRLIIVVDSIEAPTVLYKPSEDWAQGGPIIERKGITIVRCDDKNIPDAKGFWQNKHEPQWAATDGSHSVQEVYGSQGDHFGDCYQVDENAVTGPTPLIAAMRCFVASKLGDRVEIPQELV